MSDALDPARPQPRPPERQSGDSQSLYQTIKNHWLYAIGFVIFTAVYATWAVSTEVRVEPLKTKVAQSEDEATKLRTELKAAVAEADRLESECAQAGDVLSREQTQRVNADAAVSRLQVENSELRRQLEDVRSLARAASIAENDAKSRLSALETECAGLKAANAESARKFSLVESDNRALLDRVRDLQDRLASAEHGKSPDRAAKTGPDEASAPKKMGGVPAATLAEAQKVATDNASLLQPFFALGRFQPDSGNGRMTADPSPMSYSALLASGALGDSDYSNLGKDRVLDKLDRIASNQPNDRPLWPFAGGSRSRVWHLRTDGQVTVPKAHRILRQFGVAFVELGLLAK